MEKSMFASKTFYGALLIGLSAVLSHLGYTQYNELLLSLGAALGLFGVRDALD